MLTHAPGHMPRDTHPSSSISPGTPHRCLGSSARPLSVHVEKNHPHTSDTFTSSSTFTPRAQKSVCTGQSKSASYFACPPPRAHSTRPPAPPGLGLAVDRLPGVPTACAAPGASPPGSNGVKTGVRCARARSLSEQRVNKQRSTPVGSVLLSHGNDRKSDVHPGTDPTKSL